MSDPMDDLIRAAAGRSEAEPEPDRLRALAEHGLTDQEARRLLAEHGHEVPPPTSFDGGARRTSLPADPGPSMDDALRALADERHEQRS